jgi:hypothetical protein
VEFNFDSAGFRVHPTLSGKAALKNPHKNPFVWDKINPLNHHGERVGLSPFDLAEDGAHAFICFLSRVFFKHPSLPSTPFPAFPSRSGLDKS